MQFMSEDEGRRFAAGAGGEIMGKHPLQYCKPVFLGQRPQKDGRLTVFNGTATFLALEAGVFAVTCAHVVDAYFEIKAKEGEALFQIGMIELALESQLSCRNEKVDLATIKLTDMQVAAFNAQEGIGSRVVRPSKWPPDPVVEGEPLMFGGFPGAFREAVSYDELIFGSFSAAGILVSSSRSDRISCQLERSYWINSFKSTEGKYCLKQEELGGLSGGPVFADRGLHFELIGIIDQHSKAYDILFIRPVGLIRSDGSIVDELDD